MVVTTITMAVGIIMAITLNMVDTKRQRTTTTMPDGTALLLLLVMAQLPEVPKT